MSSDWLPSRRTEQLAMAKSWAAVLAVKGTQWGILAPEVTILNGFINSSQEALNLGSGGKPHPPHIGEPHPSRLRV
ncbi:MAG: NgoMIV family type II restriction endonuclease [Spirochaetes bacterium]|nr:NgoMIV family type II restriction endonuclease [Spirochaetota bacterium]